MRRSTSVHANKHNRQWYRARSNSLHRSWLCLGHIKPTPGLVSFLNYYTPSVAMILFRICRIATVLVLIKTQFIRSQSVWHFCEVAAGGCVLAGCQNAVSTDYWLIGVTFQCAVIYLFVPMWQLGVCGWQPDADTPMLSFQREKTYVLMYSNLLGQLVSPDVTARRVWLRVWRWNSNAVFPDIF